MSTLLVTGGAGFIGSNFVHLVRRQRPGWRVVVLDALTYAGNLANLEGTESVFVQGDVADPADVNAAFEEAGRGCVVVHFAAESHVDRSIESCAPFLRTNLVGTQVMIDAARAHGAARFLHVSTDEVYGSLPKGMYADESAPLKPSNPYSASKAGSDHLVLAAVNTHGFPAVITRCSNNFGPRQYPEKFVPVMIANAIAGKPLPVYGDGLYERDWIHVRDHCDAVLEVLARGRPGTTYNIAGRSHRTNLDVLHFLLDLLGKPRSLVRHVQDRPGHDRRYAPDGSLLAAELGWTPRRPFEEAMEQTVRWYRDNAGWLARVRSGEYRDYYARHYGARLEA